MMPNLLYPLRKGNDASLRRRVPRDHSTERGAALVELSIVALLLATVALGTLELGMAWSDAQLVNQAARSGARVAAQLSDDADADEHVVDAVEAGLGRLAVNPIRIVVYDAGATDGSMHNSCLRLSFPGNRHCSIYDEQHLTTFSQGNWPPSRRTSSIDSAVYVGVEVAVERPMFTGLLGSGAMTITETAVMRVEAR